MHGVTILPPSTGTNYLWYCSIVPCLLSCRKNSYHLTAWKLPFLKLCREQTSFGPRPKHFQIFTFHIKQETKWFMKDKGSINVWHLTTSLPLQIKDFNLLLLFSSAVKWCPGLSEQLLWKNTAKYTISIDGIISLCKLYCETFSSLLLWN